MTSMNQNFWEYRNVFITGATGLLGSWLVKELVKHKSNVTVLVRDWVPKSILIEDKYLDDVNIVRGELEEYKLLKRVLNEYEIETVFHLGAQTIVRIANRNPLSTFSANIQGTWNLLEACRQVNTVNRIVAASSDKAYGDQEELPYNEQMPLQGKHPYDVSKSCADLISRSYFETFGLPICVTRCGNFYGGGDLNFNRIVPETIRSLIYDKKPVIRSDGLYVRDYFYIEDAVAAYMFLAEKMDDKKVIGEAFNFSNEIQMSVKDLVYLIVDLMKKKDLEPVIKNEVQNEIKHQFLSAKKAKQILGWKPRFSLEEGMKKTIAWYEDFFRRTKDD